MRILDTASVWCLQVIVTAAWLMLVVVWWIGLGYFLGSDFFGGIGMMTVSMWTTEQVIDPMRKYTEAAQKKLRSESPSNPHGETVPA